MVTVFASVLILREGITPRILLGGGLVLLSLLLTVLPGKAAGAAPSP